MAKERLKNGKKIINTKLKHIRIADREEHGWQVVKFYESDDLASNSDDEKHLNRAKREAAAACKKMDAKKQAHKRFNPRSASRGDQFSESSKSFRRSSQLVCYGCNRIGHTRKFCFADKPKK